MKNLLIALIGAVTIVAALPAIAGPDFRAIEQARKAHQATRIARHGDAQAPASADRIALASHKLVLPLDHGPRAQSTPWLNQQRVLRAEAQVQAQMPKAEPSEIATLNQPANP